MGSPPPKQMSTRMQRPRLSALGGGCNASKRRLARARLLLLGPAVQEQQQSRESRRGASGRWDGYSEQTQWLKIASVQDP